MPNVASAAHCAAYQCGHIARSDDRAVKRALYLHLRREMGATLDTSREAADVLAVLALMREGRPCSEVREYRTPGVTRRTAPATPATTDSPRIRVSAQMLECVALVAQGYDIPEIAEATYRSVETVRSLLARCRQATAAHTSPAAAAKMAEWGLISD